MAWDSQDQHDYNAAQAAAAAGGGWGGAPGPAGGGGAGGWGSMAAGGFGGAGGMSAGSGGYGGPSTAGAGAGPVGGAAVGGPAMGGPAASPSAGPVGPSVSAGPATGPAGPVSGGGISSAVSAGPVGGGYSGGSSGYGGPSTASQPGGGYSPSSAPQGGPVGGGMPVGSSGYGGPSTAGFAGNQIGSGGQFGGGPIGGTPGYGGPGQGGGYASGYGGLGAPQGPGIGGSIGGPQSSGGFGPYGGPGPAAYGNPAEGAIVGPMVQAMQHYGGPGEPGPGYGPYGGPGPADYGNPASGALTRSLMEQNSARLGQLASAGQLGYGSGAFAPALQGLPSETASRSFTGVAPNARPPGSAMGLEETGLFGTQETGMFGAQPPGRSLLGSIATAGAPAVPGGWTEPANPITTSSEALTNWPGATAPPAYGQMGWARGEMMASPEARAAALRAMGVTDPSQATPAQMTLAAESLYAKDPNAYVGDRVPAGIPFGTMNQLINQENRRWDPNLPNQPAPGKTATSALGLTQILSGTAKDIGITDPYSPEQQIFGGASYLASRPAATLQGRLSQYGEPGGRYARGVLAQSTAAPPAFGAGPVPGIGQTGYQSRTDLSAATPSPTDWNSQLGVPAAVPAARQYGPSQWSTGAGLSAPGLPTSPAATNVPGVRTDVYGNRVDTDTQGNPVTTDAYGNPVAPQPGQPARDPVTGQPVTPATIGGVPPGLGRTVTPTTVPGLLSGTAMQPAQAVPAGTPVHDPMTGQMVDSRTGQPVDPVTGQPVAPTPGQQAPPEGLLGPMPPAQTVPSQDLPYGIGVGIDPTQPQPPAPVTQISDFYRSALENMTQPGAPPTPVEQRLQDLQTYGVFGDPAAAQRRGLVPGTQAPTAAPAPTGYDPLSSIRSPAPNTLPAGFPPTAPSLPAPQMQTREGLPNQPAPGEPMQLTQPQPRGPMQLTGPPQPGGLLNQPAPQPRPMQTGLPPGLLGPLGAGGGQGGIPMLPAQMAAGGGGGGAELAALADRAAKTAKKRKGGGVPPPGLIAGDVISAGGGGPATGTGPGPAEAGGGGGGGKGGGKKDGLPGEKKFQRDLWAGAQSLGNGYYRLANGNLAKVEGQMPSWFGRSAGGGGGGGDEDGGGGGDKKGGKGKEPFLTLGGSNKGQDKNPFLTLMGDPTAKAWKNRNPILDFNSPRMDDIRRGRRKPSLAEVAAAARPLGLLA